MKLASREDLLEIIQALPRADDHARRVATERQNTLTKPPGSLGRLEELALWLCAWQGSTTPSLTKSQAIIFAGNHGIAEQGVSAYPQEVTRQMVANFEAGGAAINQLCRSVGASLSTHAIDLHRPTADFSKQAAMTWDDCADSINQGMNAVDIQADIVLLGEMGIANTTVAAALCSGLFGDDPENWVGRGTGINDHQLAQKAMLIRAAVALHREQLDDPLNVLTVLGGHEQAAIFGAVLQARLHHIPVILDGYVCTAAAAPLQKLSSVSLDHCVVGHVSSEPGHHRLLERLNKKALLDLDMRLGEGSGAAVALAILRCAVETHNGMATFAEAGVADGEKA